MKHTREMANNFRVNVKAKTDTSKPSENFFSSPPSPCTSLPDSQDTNGDSFMSTPNSSFESDEVIVIDDERAIKVFEEYFKIYKHLPDKEKNILMRLFLNRTQANTSNNFAYFQQWAQIWSQLLPKSPVHSFINTTGLSDMLLLQGLSNENKLIQMELENFMKYIQLDEESVYSKAARLVLNLATLDECHWELKQAFAAVAGGLFLHHCQIPFTHETYLSLIQHEQFSSIVQSNCEESMSNLILELLNSSWKALFDCYQENKENHCIICGINGYNISASCCKQPFHLDCLAKWCGNHSESMKKETCPCCRAIITQQHHQVPPPQGFSDQQRYITPPSHERVLDDYTSPDSIAFSSPSLYSMLPLMTVPFYLYQMSTFPMPQSPHHHPILQPSAWASPNNFPLAGNTTFPQTFPANQRPF